MRRGSVVDLLTFVNPRRPSVRSQRRILDTDPARSQLVIGAPARLNELRERFVKVTGGRPTDATFSAFVSRQGRLALEREELEFTGRRYKVPRLVAEEISQSARFRTAVEQLARTLDEPAAKVMKHATAALDEMVASHGRLAVDVWGQFTGWMARAYELDVDEGGLEPVRELDRKHALVFLPSHRSYLDPMVLRHALARHGFPPNHTLGGINIAFWPIGPIARRVGHDLHPAQLPRRRRSTRRVLREYIAYLLRKRFNLEWYIEGGRSRTGKLRPPRSACSPTSSTRSRRAPASRSQLVPGVDRLRPAARGRQDGGRGARAPKTPGELRLAGRTTRAPRAARSGARTSASGSRCRCGEALAERRARVPTRSPSRSATGSTARRRSRRCRSSRSRCSAPRAAALTLDEGRAIGSRPILDYIGRRGLPTTGDVRVGERRSVPRRARSADPRGRRQGVRRAAPSRSTRSAPRSTRRSPSTATPASTSSSTGRSSSSRCCTPPRSPRPTRGGGLAGGAAPARPAQVRVLLRRASASTRRRCARRRR